MERWECIGLVMLAVFGMALSACNAKTTGRKSIFPSKVGVY